MHFEAEELNYGLVATLQFKLIMRFCLDCEYKYVLYVHEGEGEGEYHKIVTTSMVCIYRVF